MKTRTLVLVLLSLALAACSTTPTTQVSYRDSSNTEPYDQVLVIALSVTGIEMFREQAEKMLVQQLEQRGVKAVPRSRLFRAGEELTRELVLERIADRDIDAVLVVVGGNVQFTDRGPETYINTRGGYGDYSSSVGNAFIFQSPVPNQRMDNLEVNIISNLYDVNSTKRVWTATTTISNAGSKMEIINKVSKKIVKGMNKEGFL